MPRRHRRNYNERGHAKFLKSDLTCGWLAQSIDTARHTLDFDLWVYVFMPEHVHLVLRPRAAEYDIATVRKAIKAPVAEQALTYLEAHAPHWLPRLTRRRGDKTERLFWQSGGGYDRNIIEPQTLAASMEYIHLNPVRKGLVERAAQWQWSSAAWYVERRRTPLSVDPIPPEWCA
jgi:putative transposase